MGLNGGIFYESVFVHLSRFGVDREKGAGRPRRVDHQRHWTRHTQVLLSEEKLRIVLGGLQGVSKVSVPPEQCF